MFLNMQHSGSSPHNQSPRGLKDPTSPTRSYNKRPFTDREILISEHRVLSCSLFRGNKRGGERNPLVWEGGFCSLGRGGGGVGGLQGGVNYGVDRGPLNENEIIVLGSKLTPPAFVGTGREMGTFVKRSGTSEQGQG